MNINERTLYNQQTQTIWTNFGCIIKTSCRDVTGIMVSGLARIGGHYPKVADLFRLVNAHDRDGWNVNGRNDTSTRFWYSEVPLDKS